MTITSPQFRSMLSVPMTANNFTPIQSVQLAVSNSGATGSASKTFTVVPGGATRTTLKISNTGQKTVYIATGIGSATAVASSGTPTPAAGVEVVSNCDCIPAGAILTQDYPALTDTIAAICAGSDTSTLEISIGMGQ
jgi:hypothetical protein